MDQLINSRELLKDGRRKLSFKEIEEIKFLKGKISRPKAAYLFQVSEYTIYNIWSPEKVAEQQKRRIRKKTEYKNHKKYIQKYETKKKLMDQGLL